MRAYVFTDRALARYAGRFVWLEIDTEKRQNAPIRAKLQAAALPSFFVVDPTTEAIVLRWTGGASVPQLQKILDDGRRAVASGSAAVATAADAAMNRAERAYGAGDYAAAAKGYQEALAAAPAGWNRRGRAVESLLFAYDRIKDYEAAAKLARDTFAPLRKSPSAANIAGSGLGAALELPADHPLRAELVAALEADVRAVLDDTKLGIAADDRSGLYITWLDARQDAKDSVGARDVAVRWSAFLDGEAARAGNPEARTVFDSHRLSAYLELGEPQRAIPMLEASERDLPDDYNPPARLALAYKALKRWDEALAASDRALAKAYGPRRLVLLQARADVYKGRGDLDLARRTLEDALREAEALPAGQKSDATLATLRKKIDALAPAADAAKR